LPNALISSAPLSSNGALKAERLAEADWSIGSTKGNYLTTALPSADRGQNGCYSHGSDSQPH